MVDVDNPDLKRHVHIKNGDYDIHIRISYRQPCPLCNTVASIGPAGMSFSEKPNFSISFLPTPFVAH